MMRGVIAIIGFLLIVSGGVAEAADSTCNYDSSVSREEFESRGGKLVMTIQPDMRFPKNIAKICRGAAGLGITVLQDGKIRTEDFEHNWFSIEGDDSLEAAGRATARCDALMDARVKKIRFAPPMLAGKPVCVRFYVDWSSSEPSKLLPFGVFPR